jgi:hypothetical protein
MSNQSCETPSTARTCLHRLHTHASHITAVVPQRVYRHGLQIETHTRVHAHPESSHACTPSVIACMYTHSHTHRERHTHTHTHTHTPRHTHTHSTHTHTHTETHTHTHTHTHTPRHTHTQTHRHTRTFVCTHAVARQCRRVPVIPSTVSCCISTNLLIDTHDIDKLRLRI